jgi:hypothetical protein
MIWIVDELTKPLHGRLQLLQIIKIMTEIPPAPGVRSEGYFGNRPQVSLFRSPSLKKNEQLRFAIGGSLLAYEQARLLRRTPGRGLIPRQAQSTLPAKTRFSLIRCNKAATHDNASGVADVIVDIGDDDTAA